MRLRKAVPTLALSIAAGCAGRAPNLATGGNLAAAVGGVWDGVSRTTINEGSGAGDTRIEKQEWHLSQAGGSVTGYYIAALTFVSGDGRPYVCNREPQFSAMQRYDVAGQVRGNRVEIQEITQRNAEGQCAPGTRQLVRYQGNLQGNVLTLVAGPNRQTLYRATDAPDRKAPPDFDSVVTQATDASFPMPPDNAGESTVDSDGNTTVTVTGAVPTDVSGMWVWEHRGAAPGGDEKQEREEWHVTQDGSKISGYYDRVVHQVSSDGHAYKCSMSLDFQIATRYQITGEVRGDQVIIYENSFEILEPSACDNGKRRLDAYEGQASPEELRLVWGVGGQVLHRPRPDVPTQRF